MSEVGFLKATIDKPNADEGAQGNRHEISKVNPNITHFDLLPKVEKQRNDAPNISAFGLFHNNWNGAE